MNLSKKLLTPFSVIQTQRLELGFEWCYIIFDQGIFHLVFFKKPFSKDSGYTRTIYNLLCLLKQEYFLKFFSFFLFGCIGSSLLRVGFLQLWPVGATLHCGARASDCSGFSCCGAPALGVRASVVVAHGLSSCGARAQLLRGMWDLPGPVSPALAGGFSTTVPPGMSLISVFCVLL